jgi:peptide methionine sulfoxide reductase msrA/msrB
MWRLIYGLLGVSLTVTACGKPPEPPAPAIAAQTDSIVLGMGCFWGAEKRMSALPGVIDVESGYANGETATTYEAVLALERLLQRGQSRQRNHAEVVKVSFDPRKTTLEAVLALFWESHDPTQGNRQGNDIGSNYRSAIYTHDDAQLSLARQTRERYQAALTAAGRGKITTDIAPLKAYGTAEAYHQDYLRKNPNGYCGLGGTGVAYPRNAAYWQSLGRLLLTPEQQRIAFQQGTEAPFCGMHLEEKRPGWFVDPLSGARLFRSDAKFNSGTGWPSFYQPMPGAISEHPDRSHGMVRVEVHSASSGIHLGHVFDDGPPPTGKRYCINGNVLRFVPDAAKITAPPTP